MFVYTIKATGIAVTGDTYINLNQVTGEDDHGVSITDNVTYYTKLLGGYSEEELETIGLIKTEVPDIIEPILEVDAAQALCALADAGLYDTVNSICINHPVKAVGIWYLRSTVWQRYNPYLTAAQIEVGLTDDQVDALFKAASLK